MVRPMLSEAVAAGEGALSTCTVCSDSLMRKSSANRPKGLWIAEKAINNSIGP